MDLMELAARVEAADKASRELDAMIHYRIKNGVGCGGYSDAPRYTSSLDAAMALVPEGVGGEMLSLMLKRSYRGETMVLLLDSLTGAESAATAATPALALTAACLKALAQSNTTGGNP